MLFRQHENMRHISCLPLLTWSTGALWSRYQIPRVPGRAGAVKTVHKSCPSLQIAGDCVSRRYRYQRPLTLAISEWYWRGSLPLAPPSRKEVHAVDGSNSFLRFLLSSRKRERERRSWLLVHQWRSTLYKENTSELENGDSGIGGESQEGNRR